MEVVLETPRVKLASADEKAVPISGHIPELDGVRAIAVWMVLLCHLYWGLSAPPDTFDRMPRLIYQILGHGWLGVDLFFVLSGFLIGGILLDSRQRDNYFRTFYWRRVLRILPIFYICIIVMIFFYDNAAYFLLSATFLANFSTGLGVSVPHGPGVFWSLCIEEHFYLLWPILVRYLRRSYLTIIALLIVIITPALRLWGVNRGLSVDLEVYSYSWFRFDGLAMGALLAVWMRSPLASVRNSIWLAGLLVASSVIITVAGLPYGILMSKTPVAVALRYTQVTLVFGAFILTVISLRGTMATSFLRTGFTNLSGKLSYCL